MTEHLSRRDTLRASAGVACAGLAGCLDGLVSGDGEPENAGELGVPAGGFDVTITSRPFPEFQPQIVHVEPGATVEWVVETGRHDVTGYTEQAHPPHRAPPECDPWGSEMLPGPGSSYERSFTQEGIYDYVDTQQVCVSHEIAGNVGRVVVGQPDLDAEPAMAEPPEEMPGRVRKALVMFNEETRPALSGDAE
jgi:plastocyanin